MPIFSYHVSVLGKAASVMPFLGWALPLISGVSCLGIIMIRLYQESDIEEIIKIWREASLVAHPFLTESFLDSEEEKIRQDYLPTAQTWVYESEGKPVGFISLLGNEVGAIFVHPSMHRRGIGKALMDKACSLHNAVVLDVFEANSIGRAFYAKYGFEPTHEFIHETGELTIRLRYGS